MTTEVVVDLQESASNDAVDKVEKVEEEEEDWSNFMVDGVGLSSGGFSRHETLLCFPLVTSKSGQVVSIECVDALSPLDMIELSWGRHDATGHRVWLGAELFLYAISRLVEMDLLASKRILELGSGTGMAGIAVAMSCVPVAVCLTDASDSALDLCRRNCTRNDAREDIVTVKKLCWGGTLQDYGDGESDPFDTVLATDVLYDFESWGPLLASARDSLRENGTLILSHVPRAAQPEKIEGQTQTTIEELLVQQALDSGFVLISTMQPADLAIDVARCEDMKDVGAALFLFRKK